MIHQLGRSVTLQTAEMQAVREVASTHERAYIDVRD